MVNPVASAPTPMTMDARTGRRTVIACAHSGGTEGALLIAAAAGRARIDAKAQVP